MSRRVVVAKDGEALARAAAARIAAVLRAAVRDHGHATVALAGGDTPRRAYSILGRGGSGPMGDPVPWSRVEIFFGDERCVSPDDASSNFRMVADTLLGAGEARRPKRSDGYQPAPVEPGAVHRMQGESSDLEAAARDYEALLPEALDLVVLGIGADGHTASLFPEAASLGEWRRQVVVVEAPSSNTSRMTLTPPVLQSARAVLVLAQGKGKAAAVARALEGARDPDHVPAQLVASAMWMIDREAASGLSLAPVAPGARPAWASDVRDGASPAR